MSSNTQAAGALILVPIAIAASAAYVAIKTTEGYNRLTRYCKSIWIKSPLNTIETRRRRKLYRSDISSNQAYADSWVDLESIGSCHDISNFINQGTPERYASISKDKSEESETIRRVWHPPRNSRLMWSFTDPRPRSPGRSGLSSVAKPLPVVHRQDRSSAEDEAFQLAQTRAGEARLAGQTDR
jgi:hypothetical protein